MKRKEQSHMDGVFVLLVFGVFAACVLLVLLTGAGTYRRLTDRDVSSYNRRTCVQYVAARVRHGDAAGAVFLGDFSDALPVDGTGDGTLFLKETIDDESYYTRIYYYDGYIRELFTATDDEVSREDGEKILAARGLSFSARAGLLTVTATDDAGYETQLTLSLRGGRTWLDQGGTR